MYVRRKSSWPFSAFRDYDYARRKLSVVAMRYRWLHLIRKLWIRWLAASLTMAACLVCLSWVVLESILASTPIDVARYIEIDPSPQLFDRQNRLLQVSLNANEEWSIPVDVSAHSPYVREATIAVEDQRFEHHRGVDSSHSETVVFPPVPPPLPCNS